MVPERHAERAHRIAALHGRRGPPTRPVMRSALAHRAWLATELGTPDADTYVQRWPTLVRWMVELLTPTTWAAALAFTVAFAHWCSPIASQTPSGAIDAMR